MKSGGFFALSLLALVAASPAAATVNTIQPGDAMSSSVGGCTLNFVYDGVGALAGRVFIGTAAHCVANVGDPISSSPYSNFGTVAAIGDDGSADKDWAIIEVKTQFHGIVKAAMKGHPSYPTGVATPDQTTIGDGVQLSGYGMLFGTSAPTQERRVGVLVAHESSARHSVIAPVVWGDSGGPLVHIPTGGALGLNSRIPVGCTCSEVGPTIQGLIEQAGKQGFTIALRTV